jgi:hypothetical protein
LYVYNIKEKNWKEIKTSSSENFNDNKEEIEDIEKSMYPLPRSRHTATYIKSKESLVCIGV